MTSSLYAAIRPVGTCCDARDRDGEPLRLQPGVATLDARGIPVLLVDDHARRSARRSTCARSRTRSRRGTRRGVGDVHGRRGSPVPATSTASASMRSTVSKVAGEVEDAVALDLLEREAVRAAGTASAGRRRESIPSRSATRGARPARRGRCSVHVWIVGEPALARLALDLGEQRLLDALAPAIGGSTMRSNSTVRGIVLVRDHHLHGAEHDAVALGGEAELRPVGLVLPEAEHLLGVLVEVVVTRVVAAHRVADPHHREERSGVRRRPPTAGTGIRGTVSDARLSARSVIEHLLPRALVRDRREADRLVDVEHGAILLGVVR